MELVGIIFAIMRSNDLSEAAQLIAPPICLAISARLVSHSTEVKIHYLEHSPVMGILNFWLEFSFDFHKLVSCVGASDK